MTEKSVVHVAVSLDVEEEGLFTGQYARRAYTVANTACLKRLDPLCEQGVRPTLFCAYSVFRDAAARRELARLRDTFGAEIGAHLHHWNTPPLTLDNRDDSLPDTARNVSSGDVPLPLMAAKLKSLFDAGRDFQSAPLTSFRMGRWDLRRGHWPLLTKEGVVCDASVRPLHAASTAHGPNHFDAPSSPYWVNMGSRKIFEVPLTVTPLLRILPRALRALPAPAGPVLRAGFHTWGALALLPAYHPLAVMQAVTRLYTARGGRVLSLTWHSSEMMPGGAPHIRDSAAADRLLRKVGAWLDWLRTRHTVRCVSMSELPALTGSHAPSPHGEGDWTAGQDAEE